MGIDLDGIGQTGLFLSSYLDDAFLYFFIIFSICIVASILLIIFFPVRRISRESLSEKIRHYERLYSVHQIYGNRK